MTVDQHGKPALPKEPDGLILDAFNTSDDFEDRLSKIASPAMPGPRTPVPDLVFQQPFSDEAIDRLTVPNRAEQTPEEQASARRSANKGEVGIDPEHAQYQFYIKRLQEKQEEYPEDSQENAIKQSANVLLYILEVFQYPVEDEKRDKIIRRMKRILGIPIDSSAGSSARKAREPFLGQRLEDKVDALYKRHMRRYALHRMEMKKLEAVQERQKKHLTEAEERQQAEQRRLEKEKRLAHASQTISEEKIKQLEEEFDAMIALSASNYGVDAAKLMRFGYEDPEPEAGSPAVLKPPAAKPRKQGNTNLSRGPKSTESVMPSAKTGRHSKFSKGPKSVSSAMHPAKTVKPSAPKPAEGRQTFLTPQEIIDRNNERRRLRALAEKKE